MVTTWACKLSCRIHPSRPATQLAGQGVLAETTPPSPPHPTPPEFYANATLCGGNGTSSTLLGAALGNQMTGACGQPCMYNPNPQQGDDAVTAWRWDYDKACWWDGVWAGPRAVLLLLWCNVQGEDGNMCP